MRLRRSHLDDPGLGRRGSTYLDVHGNRLRDRSAVARIEALAIPPAWKDVWISPDERGHIQATGTDAAGRKQYLYHRQWRERRDRGKFARVRDVAERLPGMRARVRRDLTHGRGLSRDRVLAAIAGLLDLGMFRVGGAASADRDEEPSFGLSTLRPEHVRLQRGRVLLEFTGKSGVEHASQVADGEIAAVLRELRRRRRGEDRLFAYWDPSGRRWHPVDAGLVNGYLRQISGEEMTAKDFRTWHGTVTAALALDEAGPQPTAAKRRKAVSGAMREVAEKLGNTPAVARASYVDPRVVNAFETGETAGSERAVRELLGPA
ncbi:DNA topoisomerase IB [Dactylosporangium sp. CA-139114]|uniref:DNA topoisomerase IB n=1 Tax=Dactylosporangium sp. CA-139114 TaxID=3239931 RepID=UPI003D99B70F